MPLNRRFYEPELTLDVSVRPDLKKNKSRTNDVAYLASLKWRRFYCAPGLGSGWGKPSREQGREPEGEDDGDAGDREREA